MVGIVLLIGTLWISDIGSTISDISSVKLNTVVFLCLLQSITILLITGQWYYISQKVKTNVGFLQVLDVNMKGYIVESVTPAMKAGGELSKVFFMRSKWNISFSDAAAIVWVQKIISMLPFMAMCMIAFMWILIYGQAHNMSIILSPMVLLFAGMLFSLILLLVAPDKLSTVVMKIPYRAVGKEKLVSGLDKFRCSVNTVELDKEQLFAMLSLSLVIWLLFGIKAYLLALSMDMGMMFSQVFTIAFISYMVAMVPVSPGGLGTFEGSIVILLSSMGIPVSTGLTFALVLRFTTYWFVFIVSIMYVGSRKLTERFMLASPV